MRFSIIVPVYNVAKYLSECLESILSQDFTDFECIVVNDGSPDNSQDMIDTFVQKDSRMVSLVQENQGVSVARNAGIEKAKGEYILFVDGDDTLCEGALAIIDQTLKEEKNQLLICNIVHKYENEEKVMISYEPYLEYKDVHAINEAFAKKNLQLPWRCYQCAYQREFLKQHEIRFIPGIAVAEDLRFYLDVCEHNPKTLIKDIKIVKYRAFRADSAIHVTTKKSVMGQLQVFAYAYETAQNATMKHYFANQFTNIILLINRISDKQEQKVCFDFIKEKKYIVSQTTGALKYRVAKFVWKLLGFYYGSKMLLWMKH